MKAMFKNTRVGLVLHDAGGSNQALSLIENLDLKIDYIDVQGPAISLSLDYNINFSEMGSYESWLQHVDLLITCTGWMSNLEFNSLQSALKNNIYSIVVLDHWISYKDKFTKNGISLKPDELWVTNVYAFELAKKEFPSIKTKIFKDFYKSKIQRGFKNKKINDFSITYLTEPIFYNWGVREPEIYAFNFFLDRIHHVIKTNKQLTIHLKIHPSENHLKYKKLLDIKHEGYKIYTWKGNLLDSISCSKYIVGINTYALTLAIGTGRNVFSSMPSIAGDLDLPHKEIIQLRNFN